MEQERNKHANYLTDAQKDQIRSWLREGYTASQIVGLAKNQGWHVTQSSILQNYLPRVRQDFREHIEKNQLATSWFNREFRAERAAEIAEKLYGDIMEGKMFAEEVSEQMGKNGVITTTKPIYFAGMIKNWKDLIDTIGNELGQRKQQVDVNFNKNQNLNLSVLVDKIYEQDTSVDKRMESADIIDLPPGDDFSDDKGFLAVVDQQTPEEVKALKKGEDGEADAELF